MEYAIPIGLAVVVALIILVAVANAAQRRKHKERLFAEARQFMQFVEHRKALAPVATNVILKSGETAFYSAPSALYETRAVRQYQSGSTGFRVAKGVYIGGTKGRSVSTQEWAQVDSGVLTVTNRRLIFDGGAADRTVTLGKVVSVESSLSGVEVSVEGRQKSMVFGAANPLVVAAIIRICCQADDPLDLSQTTLNVTFVE